MSEVYQLIKTLKETGSTKDKVEIMKNFHDPELLKKILYQTHTYSVTFGLKTVPKAETHTGEFNLTHFLDCLDTLSNRIVTGNAAKTLVKGVFERLSKEDAEVAELILERDLGCGIGPKLINKAFKGLIPIFELMACHTLNAKTDHYLKGKKVFVQLKYDAARVCVIVKNSTNEKPNVTYFTRNGLVYNLRNQKLDDMFISAANGEDKVYDGELYQLGQDGKPLPRKVSNGVATKFIRDTAEQKHHEAAYISVWDVVTLEEFDSGLGSLSYEERYNELCNSFPANAVAETTILENAEIEEIQKISDKYIESGQEGIIAKDSAGVWQRKRVYTCLKVKEEIISEFRIVGFEEGSAKSKNEGTLGKLVLESECGVVKFNCGIFKNYPETIRDEIWFNKDRYLNKIVSVLHNGLISSEDGGWSIYLGRVIEFRFDKTEADDFAKIKAGT